MAVSLDSMRSRGIEILHDFSQYLIAAALKRNEVRKTRKNDGLEALLEPLLSPVRIGFCRGGGVGAERLSHPNRGCEWGGVLGEGWIPVHPQKEFSIFA